MTRRRARFKWRSLYVWHRYLGVAAAVLVLLAATTGWLLNHSTGLGLDRRPLRQPWLARWYGLPPPVVGPAYRVGDRWVATAGGHLLWGDAMGPKLEGHLAGAVAFQGLLAAATRQALWLLTPEGELVERLDAGRGLPVPILKLGTAGGKLVVETPAGPRVADETLSRWRAAGATGIRWAQTARPPHALVARWRAAARPGITAERLLLDLHSGRILGPWGVYLMDGAAAVLILLSASGTLLWGRALRRQRHSRRRGRREPAKPAKNLEAAS